MDSPYLINIPAKPSRMTERGEIPFSVFGSSLAAFGIALLLEPYSNDVYRPIVVFLAIAYFIVLVAIHIFQAYANPTSAFQRLLNPHQSPFICQPVIGLFLMIEIGIAYDIPSLNALFWPSSALTLLTVGLWATTVIRSGSIITHLCPQWMIPGITLIYQALLALELHNFYIAADTNFLGSLLVISVFSALIVAWATKKKATVLSPVLSLVIVAPALWTIGAAKQVPEATMLMTILFIVNGSLFLLVASSLLRAARTPVSMTWWVYGMPLAASTLAIWSVRDITTIPVPSGFLIFLTIACCFISAFVALAHLINLLRGVSK